MTDPNKTSITIILDKSGSMANCISDTIGGYNSFLEGQQKEPGECEISLIQFSNEAEFSYKSKNIKDADKLSVLNYSPMGGTALYDAIGKAVTEKGKELAQLDENNRPSKVIMVIITDGEENASKKFNIVKIKEMIEHQTKVYNWTFTFLGANLDAVSTAASIGIDSGSSLNFCSDSFGGSVRAFAAVNNYVGRTRSSSAPTTYTKDEIASNSAP